VDAPTWATTSRLAASWVTSTAVPWSGTAETISTSGRTAIIARSAGSMRGPWVPVSASTWRTPSISQWIGDSIDSTSRWPRARKLMIE
jgi:hypothetical protein